MCNRNLRIDQSVDQKKCDKIKRNPYQYAHFKRNRTCTFVSCVIQITKLIDLTNQANGKNGHRKANADKRIYNPPLVFGKDIKGAFGQHAIVKQSFAHENKPSIQSEKVGKPKVPQYAIGFTQLASGDTLFIPNK